MALLSAANVHYAIGDRPLLAGVNLSLAAGEHVALVGRNGCGKSTFLRMIAGLGDQQPDSGRIQVARNATSGYLAQDPDLAGERTLIEEARSAFGRLHELHEKLDDASRRMAEAGPDRLDGLMAEYEALQQRMEAAGGYAVDHRIEATLHGLGLGDESFGVKVRALSGGQKGRLALAKLLLAEPDILLLDEPTNHLDIGARQWLEQTLAAYSGAVILVSHDRWLLDRAVGKIYELDGGALEEYPGNYEKYRELRADRLKTRQREHEKQQQQIKRERRFIEKYRAGQRAKQAQGREKRLERYIRDELVEKPVALEAMDVRLAAATRPGDIVLSAEHLAKGYANKPLFRELSVQIPRGARVGIIGPNGAGKTTLVNTLLGETEPDAGWSRIGAQVEIGYYRQSHEHLPEERTVVEYLKRTAGSEQAARDLAGAFLFSGVEQDKPLGVLSGGERARAALAALVAGGRNLLVLDEPTNHLDIPSAENLEQALAEYTRPRTGWGDNVAGGGTLMVISHDRMLLDRLCDQLIVLDGKGGARIVLGSYSDYLRETGSPNASEPPTDKQANGKGGGRSGAKTSGKRAKSSRPGGSGAQKPKGRSNGNRFDAMSQKCLEQRIERIESELAEIDRRLAEPDTYQDGEAVRDLQSQRASLTEQLAPLEAEWARRADS